MILSQTKDLGTATIA